MNRTTTCSALEWNVMLGLCERLKSDKLHRDYLLIIFGCHFGLRISDLLSLTWQDLLDGDEITVTERKTKKLRKIKLHARISEAVDLCYPVLGDGNTKSPVFSNRWGQPISVSYVNKRLKWIFSRYRIKTQNPSSHTLRKTFGLRVYELHGESEHALVFLSEVFGHSSVAITRRYIDISQKKIADLYMEL